MKYCKCSPDVTSYTGWTLSLSLHHPWLADGATKDTNVHDDGLSPSVMKGLVTETQRKSFFLFSVSLCLRGNFLSRQRAQRRDFLFLRALSVLRGSLFNFRKRLSQASRSNQGLLTDFQGRGQELARDESKYILNVLFCRFTRFII